MRHQHSSPQPAVPSTARPASISLTWPAKALSNATYAKNTTALNLGITTTTITKGARDGVITSVVEASATSTLITPVSHPAVDSNQHIKEQILL